MWREVDTASSNEFQSTRCYLQRDGRRGVSGEYFISASKSQILQEQQQSREEHQEGDRRNSV